MMESNHEEKEVNSTPKIKTESFQKNAGSIDLQDLENNQLQNEAMRKRDSAQTNLSNLRQEKEKKKAKKLDLIIKLDIYVYIVSIIILVVIIFTQFNITNEYYVKTKIKEFLDFPVDTNYVSTQPNTLTNLYVGVLNKITSKHFWVIDMKYEFVSNIRSTFRTSKLLNYIDPLFLNHTIKRRATDNIDKNDEFNPAVESNGRIADKFDYQKIGSYQNKGGYVLNYNTTEIFFSNISSKIQISKIKNDFDKFYNSTILELSTVTFDFLVINYELGYLMPVILTYYSNGAGTGDLYFESYIIDYNPYKGSYKVFRGCLEGIYVLLSIFYIYLVISSISGTITKKQNKQIETETALRKATNKLRQRGVLINFIGNIKNNKESMNSKVETKATLLLKYFISNPIDIIFIASLVINLVCITLWATYIVYLNQNMEFINLTQDSYNVVINYVGQNELITSGHALENYKQLVAFNFLLIFTRLFKLITNAYPRTSVFIDTIYNAGADLISFFFVFFTLLIGFTFFCYIYYGRFISKYNDFLYCLLLNIYFILGFIKKADHNALYAINSGVTFVYFITLILIMRLIVLKILLAIIIHFFKLALDKFENKNKDSFFGEITFDEAKKKFKATRVIKLLRNFKKFINAVFKCCSLKQTKLSKGLKKVNSVGNSSFKRASSLREEDLDNLEKQNANKVNEKKSELAAYETDITELNLETNDKMNTEDISLLNSTYSEKSLILKRNPYFDSAKDINRLKSFFESKYRQTFFYSLIYIVYMLIVIIMIYLNNMTPWLSQVHNAMGDVLGSDLVLTNRNLLLVSKYYKLFFRFSF